MPLPRPLRPLAVLAALFLAGCQAMAPGADGERDDIVRNFETIAFHEEFAPDAPEGRLTRWDGPVRVALLGEPTPEREHWVDEHLAELGRLTGLDVARADLAAANVVVILAPDPFDRAVDVYRSVYRRYFVSLERMETVTARMKWRATCYAVVLTDRGDDIITRAVVLVPTDEGELVTRGCIIEELTQAMGLFNDSDAIAPSVFNDNNDVLLLSDHDRMLLRVLYDARLAPGMSWSEAEPAVREIVADLQSLR